MVLVMLIDLLVEFLVVVGWLLSSEARQGGTAR